jgi:hypothetical protein
MDSQKVRKRDGKIPPLEESKPAKLNMSIRKMEEGEKTVTLLKREHLMSLGVHERTCNRLIVSSIGIARAIRVIEGAFPIRSDFEALLLNILKEALHKSEMSHMDVDVNEIEDQQAIYKSACKALE